MQFKLVQDAATRFLKENATTVLTAGGVVGTITTAVVSFRAGYKTAEAVRDETDDRINPDAHPLSNSEIAKLAVPHILAPVGTTVATVVAIIMANRLSAAQAAALAAAYGVSQKQLDEYKAKVAEKLGVNKTQKIQDELAQDRVDRNPPPSQIIVIGDEVLCYDKATDRYFKSSMEKIKRAENALNLEIQRYGFAKAQFFYSEFEMDPTTWTQNAGWNRPVEVQVSHALSKDDRPCITIDFDHLPDPNYQMDYS